MRADVADHCIAVGVWHVEQRLDVLERVLKDAVGRHALPPEEGVQAGPAQRSVVFRSQEACRVMQPLHAEAPALRQVHLQRRPEAVLQESSVWAFKRSTPFRAQLPCVCLLSASASRHSSMSMVWWSKQQTLSMLIIDAG